MRLELFEFQRKAVEWVVNAAYRVIGDLRDESAIVLKSIGGSGKTLMLSRALEKLFKLDPELVAIWICIAEGGLIGQSRRVLEKDLKGCAKCVSLSDKLIGQGARLEPGEILMMAWDEVNSADVNVARKGGDFPNIDKLISNTKAAGRRILVVIDESQKAAHTKKADEVKEICSPNAIIEISATPVFEDETKYIYEVPHEDVIAALLIKERIDINPGVKASYNDSDDDAQLMLRAALQYAENQRTAALEEGKVINPLVTVQLPQGAAGKERRTFVEDYLSTISISYEKGNLALYLSGEEENFTGIENHDSPVKVAIIKNAKTTGWDNPRNSVLVKYRKLSTSETFEVQTQLRLLRAFIPGHRFNNPILHRAAIFSNEPKFETAQDKYSKLLFKFRSAELRTSDFSEWPVLETSYKPRETQNSVESGIFSECLDVTLNDLFGLSPDLGKEKNEEILTNIGYDLYAKEVKAKIISDGHIEIVTGTESDLIGDHTETAESSLDVRKTPRDMEVEYEQLLTENIADYARARSIPIVKRAIRLAFSKLINSNFAKAGGDGLLIPILLNNEKTTAHILQRTITKYTERYALKTPPPDVKLISWDGPEAYPRYNIETEEISTEKCVYNKHYRSKRSSKPEILFESYIDKYDFVLWWYRNGNKGAIYLAIEYFDTSNGKPGLFYVDYITWLEFGFIGLFDTKTGTIDHAARDKALGLKKYCEARPNLIGGLVRPASTKSGFEVCIDPERALDSSSLTGWLDLEEFVQTKIFK